MKITYHIYNLIFFISSIKWSLNFTKQIICSHNKNIFSWCHCNRGNSCFFSSRSFNCDRNSFVKLKWIIKVVCFIKHNDLSKSSKNKSSWIWCSTDNMNTEWRVSQTRFEFSSILTNNYISICCKYKKSTVCCPSMACVFVTNIWVLFIIYLTVKVQKLLFWRPKFKKFIKSSACDNYVVFIMWRKWNLRNLTIKWSNRINLNNSCRLQTLPFPHYECPFRTSCEC
jgi:hypothetical protein